MKDVGGAVMNLDGVRNAKAEIFQKAFGFGEQIASSATAAAMPSFMRATRSNHGIISQAALADPTRYLALGIGSSDEAEERATNRAGKQLLIFGQRKRLRDHPVVEKAIKLAKGEARFVYTGPIQRASFWVPARYRPVAPGCSAGHRQVTAGTLGGYVRMRTQGGMMMLSNNHVFANSNRAQAGDAILQPGKADGGANPADVIGHLYHFIPLLDQNRINVVDCAVATMAAGVVANPLPCVPASGRSGVQPTSVLDEVDDAIEIVKVGRTTGVTFGSVWATEVDNVIVDYGTPQRPMLCRFDGQISAYSGNAAFAKRGDSGSIATTVDGKAVGLVFAVSEAGGPTGFGLTFMNPFSLVLQELDAELWLG